MLAVVDSGGSTLLVVGVERRLRAGPRAQFVVRGRHEIQMVNQPLVPTLAEDITDYPRERFEPVGSFASDCRCRITHCFEKGAGDEID